METVTPQDVAPVPVKRVTAAGGVTTGGVLSTTVTSCVSVAIFPDLSVAVYVTVVIPTGNILPAGTPLRVTITPGQLSLDVAEPSAASDTKVPQLVAPGPVDTLTGPGAVIVGGIAGLSVTVIS